MTEITELRQYRYATQRIDIRVTADEKKSIESEAERCGMTVSAYLLSLHEKHCLDIAASRPENWTCPDGCTCVLTTAEGAVAYRIFIETDVTGLNPNALRIRFQTPNDQPVFNDTVDRTAVERIAMFRAEAEPARSSSKKFNLGYDIANDAALFAINPGPDPEIVRMPIEKLKEIARLLPSR